MREREILDSPRDQSVCVRDLGPLPWDRWRLPWDLRALPWENCFSPKEMEEIPGMGRLAGIQNPLNCRKLGRWDGQTLPGAKRLRETQDEFGLEARSCGEQRSQWR